MPKSESVTSKTMPYPTKDNKLQPSWFGLDHFTYILKSKQQMRPHNQSKTLAIIHLEDNMTSKDHHKKMPRHNSMKREADKSFQWYCWDHTKDHFDVTRLFLFFIYLFKIFEQGQLDGDRGGCNLIFFSFLTFCRFQARGPVPKCAAPLAVDLPT